ncbi:MAG TPA: hypothetical protein VK735_39580 [Pseudonocardia sp.]|uniref:VG15 protein n=1 Tax=Pseudonocardia sp. TaxID=60912 RepID=UPI002C05951F|nr:hypothetical protein [Pseudonocardia sp.]HTF53584.1 hypothetical protein [Pseudonocardia sp.]
MTTELEALRLLAISALLAAMQDSDMSTPSGAWRTLREIFIDITIVYGEQAAMSAIRYLELDRSLAGVDAPPISLINTVELEQIERSLGWSLRPLDEGDLLLAERRMAGALQRLIEQPNRETIFEATVQANTRYARVPRPGACAFCVMLASRGGVYDELTVLLTTGRSTGTSGRSAGLHYHDNCHCTSQEIREGEELQPANQRAEKAWEAFSESVRGAVTLGGFEAYLKDHPFE